MGEKLSADFFDESPNKWDSLRDESLAPSSNALENLKISPEEYEQLGREERRLRNGCFETGEGCGNVVAGGIYDIRGLIEQKYKSAGNELTITLNDTAFASKNFSRQTTEALINMIDVFYPSHFGNKTSNLSRKNAEEEYTIAVNRNSTQLAMNIDDVAKAASGFDDFKRVEIPSSIKSISNSMLDDRGRRAFVETIVKYLENPTEDERKKLSGAFCGQTENITRQLKGLEEETSKINQNDFSESIYRMKTSYNSAKGDNINAVLGYIDFKVEHGSKAQAEAPKESKTEAPKDSEPETPEDSEYRKKLENLFL